MLFTVLGTSGFIGGNLAERLRGAGHDVLAPSRTEIAETCRQPLGHVIYCIGLTADFRSRPFDTVRAHVSLLSDLLEHGQFASLLYLSSTRVYARAPSTMEDTELPVSSADPSDLYNLSKLMGESLCLHSGRSATRVARLSNVVGFDPGSDNFVQALVREALAGEIVLQSAPQSSKDYVAMDDVLDLLPRIALGGRSRLYNVAGGRNIRHDELTAELQALTGCAVRTAPDAPVQSFIPIAIGRIRAEFGAEPRPAFDRLPDIIAAHRAHAATRTASRSVTQP
jgi:nucleoside-diphosphate-sugar epimerase